ncbi:MAG: hypothetical protein HZC36_10910 [Armatimonadetes bacterium]|nr:hypothetical protein [Armatimonadota bacterium]
MMFRKLYWITEQADPAGAWRSTGVYTSIHDLVDHGLRFVGHHNGGFRITLVKLDCCKDVLGSWSAPQFEGLSEALGEYVGTGEFGVDEIHQLSQALIGFSAAKVG